MKSKNLKMPIENMKRNYPVVSLMFLKFNPKSCNTRYFGINY